MENRQNLLIGAGAAAALVATTLYMRRSGEAQGPVEDTTPAKEERKPIESCILAID
jgi:hypothetical protein